MCGAEPGDVLQVHSHSLFRVIQGLRFGSLVFSVRVNSYLGFSVRFFVSTFKLVDAL